MRYLIFLLFVSLSVKGQKTVAQNLAVFDTEWAATDYLTKSTTADQGALYFADYGFLPNGLVFQATGDYTYLERTITLIMNWYDTAVPSNTLPNDSGDRDFLDTYLSWWDYVGNGDIVYGQAMLSDWHGLRYLPKILHLMYQYPEIRAHDNGALPGTTYQTQYDILLPFAGEIWEKWHTRDTSVPQAFLSATVTHIQSHIANYGMYMFLITGDQKYKTHTDGYFGNMTNLGYSSSFLNQFHTHPVIADGVDYDDNWGNLTGSNDHSHANADVRTIINAFELGQYDAINVSGATYPNVNQDVINRLVQTAIFIYDGYDGTFKGFIDGTTAASGNGSSTPLGQDGWAQLGRYSETFQTAMENATLSNISLNSANYKAIITGVMVYNRAYLNGTMAFPDIPSNANVPVTFLQAKRKNFIATQM